MARPGHAARRRTELEGDRTGSAEVADSARVTRFDANRLNATRLDALRLDAARLDATRFDATRFAPDGGAGERDQRPTLPPRIGAGRRRRSPAGRKADGLILWRVLGVSAAVLILGMGGVLAFHLIAPGATQLSAAAPAPAPQPPRQIAEAGHAQAAMKVASILGAAGEPAPAPSTAVAVLDAEAAPTAADFARPAFLEPLDGDAAEDAATLPDGAVEAEADGATEESVPLPLPKPAKMAASDDDDARSARIRSDVTLRSGPRRSASVLGTLDGGTRVKLYSCKSWCEVSTGSKRGYVYRTAVAR